VTIHERDFRLAMTQLATGVTVLTLRDASGADQGMTVSAFASLSLSPPLVLACIGLDATIAPALAETSLMGVSILAADQDALSRRFAESGADRFRDVAVRRGNSGVPLIEGAVAQLEGRIVARYPGGDHTIIVCEVLEGTVPGGEPLVYHRGAYARLEQ
jgi:3-hydroxy-9,10-secoandrosta-1,3,5(10)-triene-9,17-dione monooxygenase reductase component